MTDYTLLTDAELVALLRTSDHGAYTEIYNRFFGILYVFVQKRVGDDDEARDIVQELFANVWIKRDALSFSGVLAAYLYTAVRNKMLDALQKRDLQRKYLRSLHDYMERDNTMADDHIREQQLKNLIEKEVDALPKRMQQVFQMSRNDNMSYKEIAVELKLTPMSVKLYGKSALKKLRDKLSSSFS